ncbi:hypothetical protein F7734_48865 [Scytonema sp. UIC 10036]|uniref:helix-turn-helix domain-containing protein n=1 Tax=Scytonema sp. UIC 10036 TaxID=2304196 RepID=UPI0012DA6A18|nr:helix-turn-helix domain-containing protein [Scytonema sp. UIC 10036]MUG99771.1 hypothetical protein [Scytonema sp. UIC 10036]
MEEQEDFYLTWRTNKLASLRYNRAICMLAAGYSPNEVAEHLGVTVRAVQMWFKEGDFNDSLRYAIHITFQSALSKAADFADRAVQILIDIAENPDTPSKQRIESIKLLFDILLRTTQSVPENPKVFELSEKIKVLNQATYFKSNNVVTTEIRPVISKTGLAEMRDVWTIIHPNEPFPEDETELRKWFDDNINPFK